MTTSSPGRRFDHGIPMAHPARLLLRHPLQQSPRLGDGQIRAAELPHLGFLHGIRPAKPALVLDLMEEFRTPLADRFVLNLVNRRQVTRSDFDTLPGGAVRLSEDGRKTVLTAWQAWRSEEREHPLLGRNVPHGLLPVVQARLLARHLRGELPGYIPWTPS